MENQLSEKTNTHYKNQRNRKILNFLIFRQQEVEKNLLLKKEGAELAKVTKELLVDIKEVRPMDPNQEI